MKDKTICTHCHRKLSLLKELWNESKALYSPEDGKCENYEILTKLNQKIAFKIEALGENQKRI